VIRNRVIALPVIAFTAAFVSILAFAHRAGADSPDPAYVQDFEKWKGEETEDLKANWLSLVGLFWLKPGVSTFGTDPSNTIVFTKGPARAGEFVLQGKDVTLRLGPEANATIGGKPATMAKLDPDISNHATKVEMGSLTFHVIVRGDRVGIRVRDRESAAHH
jgi:hypothetical protein